MKRNMKRTICGEQDFSKEENVKTKMLHVLAVIVVGLAFMVVPAVAADKKPNIVIIWGDDIGQSNVSAYLQGLMGYKTPNIDRVQP
jgi:hypothetical protein